MTKHLMFFFVLFVCTNGFGQIENSTSLIEENDIEMSKEWTGTIDGSHKIKLKLNISNNSCKGEYQILSSNQVFQLEGVIENEKYILQEIDDNLKISGNLNFDVKEGKSTGIWSQNNGNVFLRLDLYPTSKFANIDDKINKQNWHRVYYGKLDNSNLKIDIIKENNANIRVNLLVDRIKIDGICECVDPQCHQFSVRAKGIEHLYDQLNFKLLPQGNVSLIVDYATGQKNR